MTRVVEFEIALSFAGEDRGYVDQVANILRDSGVKVFYDLFEEANLWGKNLYDHLSDIYQNKALYTIMFISEHYARKMWPSHERQAMQARAFQEHQEYILPARFDGTPIPGVLPTVAYIALAGRTPQDFVQDHSQEVDQRWQNDSFGVDQTGVVFCRTRPSRGSDSSAGNRCNLRSATNRWSFGNGDCGQRYD